MELPVPEVASCGLGPPTSNLPSLNVSAPSDSEVEPFALEDASCGLGPPSLEQGTCRASAPSNSEVEPFAPEVASCGLGPSASGERTSFSPARSPAEARASGEVEPAQVPLSPPAVRAPGDQAFSEVRGKPVSFAPGFRGGGETCSHYPQVEFGQPSASEPIASSDPVFPDAAASLPACSDFKPAPLADQGPGARAPPVKPAELWSEFFLSLSRAKCSLSSFFHSFRLLPRAERGPSCTTGASQSKRIWPMPLPYPEQLLPYAERDEERLGVDAVILVLDWLFLGQPSTVQKNLRLSFGEPLSPAQWSAVESFKAWNSAGPFTAKDLGRAASKFEGLYDMLAACQSEWKELQRAGVPAGEASFSYAAPCSVLPVEPSRLNFVGSPSFDPVPFLDSRNRATYMRPLDFARELSAEDVVPRVAVRADRRQTRELLSLLDRTGRLRLFKKSEIRPALRNGLFSVAKDHARDRMVLDARPPNLVEETESRWIRSLGTLEQFQFIFLPPECDFEIYTEDLKEFYHAFQVSDQRARRNVFALELEYSDVAQLSACSRSLRGHTILASLNTMAMGDLNAVAYGQTAHLAVLLRTRAVALGDFVTLLGRPPRPGRQVAGLLIDDFILLDPVPRSLTEAGVEPPGARTMRAVIRGYQESGLPRNESKSVSRAPLAEFWGGVLDGRSGLLRPSYKRVCALAQFIVRLVQGGISSVGMLEVVAGGLISGLQLRRRLLSLLDSIYRVQQHRDRRSFIPVKGDLCSELLACAALLSQVDVDLRAPAAPLVLTTDASSSAEAGASASLPPALSLELTQHGLQRGLWGKLLSPMQAYLRERGELEEGEGMPDGCYSSHPLWEELCQSLPFSQFGRVVQVKARRHINIGEVRAAIRGEERVLRLFPGHRYVHLQDSQVALASFVKGRSSSASLNRELRRSLPSYLASRIRPAFGYIQSKLNPSDDPTRCATVRAPSKACASWLLRAWQGDFSGLDRFLHDLELDPRQLAGLPEESELWADGPVAEVPRRSTRRIRGSTSPEHRANVFLQRSVIGTAEALEIFRRLPKEVSARSSRWSTSECSFSAGVFVHGGITGLRRSCEAFPTAIQVLTRVLREAKPGFVFSSLSVNQNVRTLPHVDRNNLSTEPNLVLPLARFQGGGIWVKVDGGADSLQHKGVRLQGEVLPVSQRAVAFDPHRLHSTQPWKGTRTVLIGYTVRGCEKLSDEQRATALNLGFPLPPLGELQAPLKVDLEQSQVELEPVRAPAQGPEPPPRASASPADPRAPGLQPLRVDPASFCSASVLDFAAPAASSPPGLAGSPEPPTPSVLGLLLNMPPGRFVISSAFADFDSALRSAPGWLDLFSGSRGFAKALVAAAPCWVLCLDVAHSEDEDLLREDLQALLLRLIAAKAFAGVSAGPVCSSFSSAITPAWRTREYPQGRPDLRQDQRDKVLVGNKLLEFCLEVVRAAARGGLTFWIENPQGSWFWKQPAWTALRADATWDDFLCDFCAFGTKWRKATRFRTNGQLGGSRVRCPGGHVHHVLRGRDRSTGVSWTKLAEPYPRKLTVLLAAASAQDVGWLGDFRPLDIARCARCCSGRVGEASNPGPRRAARQRPSVQLREVATVTKNTAKLRSGLWNDFQRWLGRDEGGDIWETLEQQPDLLVEVLKGYGQHLYDRGRSLQEYHQLLAHCQHVVPRAKPVLKPAWDLLTKWERLEPTVHRTPMPEPVAYAMVSLAVSWGWHSWAGTTLLCFLGCCRIGEVLGARRSDLLTPKDLLQADLRYYLLLREPKTRGRGARVQHVAIDLEPDHAQYIEKVWGLLKASEALFPWSPAVYRRRWDKILGALEIPSRFKLTPGCLRGGGAVAAYRRKRPVADIQWVMRLQNQATLAYYLQEVSAESVLPKLSFTARENVRAAAALLPIQLRYSPAH